MTATPALLRYASNWLHRYLYPPNYRRIRRSQGTPFIPKTRWAGLHSVSRILPDNAFKESSWWFQLPSSHTWHSGPPMYHSNSCTILHPNNGGENIFQGDFSCYTWPPFYASQAIQSDRCSVELPNCTVRATSSLPSTQIPHHHQNTKQ